MKYISLPRDITQCQLNATYIKFDEDDEFNINPDANENWGKLMSPIEGQIEGRIYMVDKRTAIFNKCFINNFIYELYVEVPEYYYEKRIEIINKHHDKYKNYKERLLHDDALKNDLLVYGLKTWSLENQVIYKYLDDNLKIGEFSEIYTSIIEEEDENGMYFFPPTSEISISLNELLTLPYPMDWIDFGEREKITIHKTE